MSDHKIVITDINIKAKSKKSVPGKVYIYNNKKANMNVIKQHLDKENTVFTNNAKQIVVKKVGKNLNFGNK